LAGFFETIANGKKLPSVEWKMKSTEEGAELRVAADQPIRKATLWTADSANRDFRNETWKSDSVAVQNGSVASAKMKTPSRGYRAYLLETEFSSPRGFPYKLSTQAIVLPDNIK